MFTDNEITRFQNGVNNREVGDIFNSLPTMDPTRLHAFFDDFDAYLAGDWTVTDVGAATQALADANGGRLLITNAGGGGNSSFLDKVGESFLFETGKKAFFRALIQVNDAVQSDFVVGLQITDPTPLAVTDGVYFRKDDGDALLDFVAIKNSVAVTAAGIATVVDATDLEVAFYWDGISRIWYGVNGSALGYIDPGVSLPDDEVLTVSFGIQNGEAVSKTMLVDYIYAAMER